MRRLTFLATLTFLAALLAITLSTSLASLSHPPRPAAPSAAPATQDVLANLPVSFEPVGDDRFVSRGPGYSLSLTSGEAALAIGDARFTLRPAGPTANLAADLVPAQPLPGTVSRITGDDPSRWSTGLSTYARVEIRQVWPGVDMVWHGDQRRLEHDMVVAPGTDPGVVALDVDGARSLNLDPGGDLLVDLGGRTARLARPVVYQEVAGARTMVAGEFLLLGPSRLGFRLGAFDPTRPLVIDPRLVTSTFLGGIGSDAGYAIAVDTQGNTYVTGSTESADFPTNAPLQNALNAASDVFVSKISPDGGRLIWSTYLGGRGRDTGFSLAVAADGSVFVAGVTESSDFPVARAAQSTFGGGPSDAFVARITANGTGIEWSTFVGGSQTDRARGVALDSGGNAYVTGSTSSTDFPAVNPQQPGPFRADDLDAFIVKVPATGGPLTFATRLGGSNDDHGLAIAVDTQGNAYVTGDTLSPSFPTVRPIQAALGGSASGVAGSAPDAFVAKYNPNGSALVYSTFLGGSDFDQGTAITVDAQGAAYVAGNTNSPNFPTVIPVQATKGNEPDAFVAKIDPPGSTLVYSTYFGGSGADGANGIAVDKTGSAHVIGTTGSANLTMVKPIQPTKAGGDDAFVLRLDSTGRGPLFSTFVGGKDSDSGSGVAIDSQGGVHILGLTGSADFPSLKPVQGSRPATGGDAFVTSLSLVDPAAPSTSTEVAAPAASASSTSSHDRRVRVLFVVTLLLLLAAIIQTALLRRRVPALPVPRARPAPRPTGGPPGLYVPNDMPPRGARKASGATKAAASKATRSPKTRGGPKSGPPQRASGAQKGPGSPKVGNRPTPVVPARPDAEAMPIIDPLEFVDVVGGDVVETALLAPEFADTGLADDGGPPTELTELPVRARPQEPAIAQLLEEDLWAREPQDDGGLYGPEPGTDQAGAPVEWAPFDTGSTAVVGPGAPSETGPPIPPVPAEELSFWDLFPEDLPPIRPIAFPADDLLADYLALPEGPETAAERLAEPAPPPPAPAPPPPESEIVIAELLDGPIPTGTRPPAESQWAPPPPGADFLIDDLVAAPDAPPAPADGPENDDPPEDEGTPEDEDAPARTPAEQARTAADRARRRRSRRGGRGRGRGPATPG